MRLHPQSNPSVDAALPSRYSCLVAWDLVLVGAAASPPRGDEWHTFSSGDLSPCAAAPAPMGVKRRRGFLPRCGSAMLSSWHRGTAGRTRISLIRWCLHWVSPSWRELATPARAGLQHIVSLRLPGLHWLSFTSRWSKTFFATATQISMFWVYLAIPVGCGSLALIQDVRTSRCGGGTCHASTFRCAGGSWRMRPFLQLVERDE